MCVDSFITLKDSHHWHLNAHQTSGATEPRALNAIWEFCLYLKIPWGWIMIITSSWFSWTVCADVAFIHQRLVLNLTDIKSKLESFLKQEMTFDYCSSLSRSNYSLSDMKSDWYGQCSQLSNSPQIASPDVKAHCHPRLLGPRSAWAMQRWHLKEKWEGKRSTLKSMTSMLCT